MKKIVTLENVRKVYHIGKTQVEALKDISFDIEENEFLCIAGPSGSGKTTLLNLIGCLDKPTRGEIEIEGERISLLSSKQLTLLRRNKIGFIFQNFNLIPVLTVYENVEYPFLNKGVTTKEKEELVSWALEIVGLSRLKRSKPSLLSGGERQRVAIARALVTKPRIILADEPTANLDSQTGKIIINLLREINTKEGTTFIFSTHDPLIINLAHRIIKLQDGKIM